MTSPLPVAILAGGLATRLRPITETIPKALVEIQGKPFIFHQLELLKDQGIEKVVLCIGYLGEMIQREVGKGEAFGLQVEYSFDGPVLLGTAGSLKKGLPLLGEVFFVLYGDSYLLCNFLEVQRAFEKSGFDALMTLYHNKGQWDKSNVEFAHGEILVYDKANRTPRMEHIDYGLGIFKSSAFEGFQENQPYDLARLYQDILQRGNLGALEVKERFYEAGSKEGIEELREYIAHR